MARWRQHTLPTNSADQDRSSIKKVFMAHQITVIVGSLRKEAFSLKIAKVLQKIAPAELKLELLTLEGVSFFNQDLEANPPADWLKLRETLKASAGVILVTPEYNRSIPGVLKNAIDVASRPYGKSSLNGIPLGIIGNSPGAQGGVSAVKHLQNILPGISGPILQQPEMYLGMIGEAFDDKGELTKDAVKEFLVKYIEAFAAFVAKQKS